MNMIASHASAGTELGCPPLSKVPVRTLPVVLRQSRYRVNHRKEEGNT